VKVGGYDSLSEGKKVRGMIGYMPQAASLHNDLTVKQTLQFYSDLRGGLITQAYSFLDRVELSEVQQVRVGELSGGMKQRLSFAVAQIGDPKVLLLDEPTVSMDQRSQQILLSWLVELKEGGKTILLSTHLRQDILSIIDRTITLDHGKVISTSSGENVIGDTPHMYIREQATNIFRKKTA
jgi:ABC-type multidrug transport system ATPase subunit